jgi:F0F1-type ATP synthase assembly protein I
MALKREPSPPNKKPSRYNNYLKYSGLGLQLLLTIGISGWLGYLLDQYLNNKYPIFMLLLGFLGFFGIMYKIYRSINRQP